MTSARAQIETIIRDNLGDDLIEIDFRELTGKDGARFQSVEWKRTRREDEPRKSPDDTEWIHFGLAGMTWDLLLKGVQGHFGGAHGKH